ncbi:15072_t:CDS:2 [Rhizophagus irregularis]|nr:15072_t:CDS:2 [Rhizophagus irregularis]
MTITSESVTTHNAVNFSIPIFSTIENTSLTKRSTVAKSFKKNCKELVGFSDCPNILSIFVLALIASSLKIRPDNVVRGVRRIRSHKEINNKLISMTENEIPVATMTSVRLDPKNFCSKSRSGSSFLK